MMLDLPQPFGPMMPVSGASTGKVVLSAKDLKPARRMAVRCMFLLCALRGARIIAVVWCLAYYVVV